MGEGLPDGNNWAKVPKAFLEDIVAARANGKFEKHELDPIVDRYLKEKSEATTITTEGRKQELQKVNALLVESFDDMFEEYELKGKEDFERIQRLLTIVNPMRLATDKPGVILAKEIGEYYGKNENAKEYRNITLDSNGQLRFQKFYEGWFTRNGVAEVKKTMETVSEADRKKLAKMLVSASNMLRGSNPDYVNYMNDAIENAPALSVLISIPVSSIGDLHLGQLETINGQVRISDVDDALTNGSPVSDIVRTIASIRVSSENQEEAAKNIKLFLDALQGSLSWPYNSTSKMPKNLAAKDQPETALQLLKGGFVNANEKGEFQRNVTKISETEKTFLSTMLGKNVIDGRHDASGGVGSAGKDKILVTVQDSKEIKIYEFKEQEPTHVYATFFHSHPNSERAEVAKNLGVDIQAVEINGRPYTQKEIVPGFVPFDADKSDSSGKTWASETVGLELAKLYKKDGKWTEVLVELRKPEVQEALKKLGGDYTIRTKGAYDSARSAYPEIVAEILAENEKKEATKVLGKKIEETVKALNTTPPVLANLQKAQEGIKESIIDAKKKNVDQKFLDAAGVQFTVIEAKIAELTKPTELQKDAPRVPKLQANAEKLKDQIDVLETFLNNYRHDGENFWFELQKNQQVFSALKTILELPENASYKGIRAKTEEVQGELELPKDGAFGRNTFNRWKESEKYGKKQVSVEKN